MSNVTAPFHAYYLPAQRAVHGTDDPGVKAMLYALYVRFLPPDAVPGRYDGTSVVVGFDPSKMCLLPARLTLVVPGQVVAW